MRRVRTVQSATHFKRVAPAGDTAVFYTPCSGGDVGALEMAWRDVPDGRLVPPAVTFRDFKAAADGARGSVDPASLDRYAQWTEQYGSDGK